MLNCIHVHIILTILNRGHTKQTEMRYGTRASQVHTNCAATELSNWRYVTTTAKQRKMRAGEKSRGRHYTTTQQSVAATAFVQSARTVKWAGGVRTTSTARRGGSRAHCRRRRRSTVLPLCRRRTTANRRHHREKPWPSAQSV